MSNLDLAFDRISRMNPAAIAQDPAVRDKFVEIYNTMWAHTTGISGESAYEKESRNYTRIMTENESLRTKCTPFSCFLAFIDVAISGVSLEPGTRAQAYLLSRNTQVGTQNGKKVYANICNLTLSGYGELVLRQRLGQIRHVDNPVVVYEEDIFEHGEHNGQKFVNYTCRLPHASGNIVAAYMKITRADGTIDYAIMLPEAWQRLSQFSAQSNSRYDQATQTRVPGAANALYGVDANGRSHIDPGFLQAKLLKHAFKSYPKARIGKSTLLESQIDDMGISDDIYGATGVPTADTYTGEVSVSPAVESQAAPTSTVMPPTAQPPISAGVAINVNDDDLF